MFFIEGLSIREISRRTGHARDTISKYVKQDAPPPQYTLQKERSAPVMDTYIPIIEKWIEEDKQRHRKQNHTAKRIYDRLVEEYQFKGGYSTVRAVVRHIKKKQLEVFIPRSRPADLAWMEIDFGEAEVFLGGKKVSLPYFVATGAGATGLFVQFFPTERQEALCEGLKRAFEWWGGVPDLVIFDNATTAVKEILKGRNRTLQDFFRGFKGYYAFETEFCQPAKGNEKGTAEEMVKFVRANWMVPEPSGSTIEELNHQILLKCQARRQTHPLPYPMLRTLPPKPFEVCLNRSVKVNKMSWFQFEKNIYSVPTVYARMKLDLDVYVDKLVIRHKRTVVAEHRRCYEEGQEFLILDHYLDALTRKPGALPTSKALHQSHLSPVYWEYFHQLKNHTPDANRQFIHLLLLRREYDDHIMIDCLEKCIKQNLYSAQAIQNSLQEKRQEMGGNLASQDIAHLPVAIVPSPSPQKYNQLLNRRRDAV